MLRSLYSSASGMQSQQLNLDVISNNLANVNTTGFKKSRIEFQDLLYQAYRAPGSDQGGGNLLPTGLQLLQSSSHFLQMRHQDCPVMRAPRQPGAIGAELRALRHLPVLAEF